MRAGLDAATLALYLSGAYDVHAMVRIANGDGTMIDLQGRWIGIRFEFPNPDTPIPTCTIDLLREYAAHESGADSLAPMVQTSTWNRLDDGVTYSPLVEIGRTVAVHVALTAIGAARPASNSPLFYQVFIGFVTKRPAPKKLGRVLTMHCTQRTGLLEIAKSEAAYTYAAGLSIEGAIRAVLDNNGFYADSDPAWILDVPAATGKVLSKTYAPGRQKTPWEQVWGLAQSVGMLLLPTYQADETVELQLFEPPRAKTLADMTVPKVHDFEEFDVDGKYLGNVGYAQFTDSSGVRAEAGPVEDLDSIARYGGIRRPFWLSFAEDSPVRSYSDAVTILGKAVADVADPEVLATVSTPAMPFIECARDLYAYAEDARFFTGTQQYAPFSAWWEIRADQMHRGGHSVSGKPSAGYRTWRSRIVTSGIEDDPANRNLYDPFLVEAGDGSADATFKHGPGVVVVMGATGTYPTPRLQAHKAALQATGALEPLAGDSIHLAAPPAGQYTLARVVAYDSAMQPSEELFFWLAERFTTPEELATVESAALAATLAAAGAQATADGKVNTFYEHDPPGDADLGDLWIDRTEGNILRRWDGTGSVLVRADWEVVQDQAIIDAILAAVNAQNTADGKIVSFWQTTPPTAEGVGDRWTDTDDNNHEYRWNGSAWVSIRPKSLGMHIGSITPDTLGTARVVANAEPDVAIGAAGAQYQLDGGAWTDLTVDANRTVAFDVTQTGVVQAVALRGLRVLGDTATAGPLEMGEVPLYIPPPVLLTASTLLSVTEVGSDHVYAGKVTGSGMLGKSLRLRWYEDGVAIETDDPIIATDHHEVLVGHTEAGAGDGLSHTHRLEVDLYDADTDYGTKVSRNATTLL